MNWLRLDGFDVGDPRLVHDENGQLTEVQVDCTPSKRMDAWSPAYDKRKSPTMDAVLDGAMTNRASDKWVYARQIATVLSAHGLTGHSMTLPVTYGWMMGYPPGWLALALRSAMARGSLLPASSSRRSATPSSRKSLKP